MRQAGKVTEPGSGALFVAAGIFLSRILGLVRERIFAHYFGNSMAAAAFKAALRIPNFLQNLLGEGVLSASFIPVYARLLTEKERRSESDELAGAVFGLLCVITGVLTALGLWAAPVMVDLVAAGFKGEARELTIRLVRILFPGTGALVLSAWCLGILNSHRRFFLSYVSPVVWNFALIGCLLVWGRGRDQSVLAGYLSYAAVAGSVLQFLVQLPSVLGLLGRFQPNFAVHKAAIRQVVRSFGPTLLGRGVVQISAYVDTACASLISERALSCMAYAQTIYLIPVSLFGMAISAAELPALSQISGTETEIADRLKDRLHTSSRRIVFFVLPTAATFFFLGDVVGGGLLQTGRFGPSDTRYLWYLLIGSSVGLLSNTLSRLYASVFYALRDTKTPFYVGAIRVAITGVLAFLSATWLSKALGPQKELSAVGITATFGFAAWIEMLLLKRQLVKRLPLGKIPSPIQGKVVAAGALSVVVGLAIKLALAHHFGSLGSSFLPPPRLHPILTALMVLGPFGLSYLALTYFWQVPESHALIQRITRPIEARRARRRL